MPKTIHTTQSPTLEQAPAFKINDGTHKPFSWLHGAAVDSPHAAFVTTTLDICAGVQTCLEIIHASGLERENNQDADPGTECMAAVGVFDQARLLRLAIASMALLRDAAEHKVALINDRAVQSVRLQTVAA